LAIEEVVLYQGWNLGRPALKVSNLPLGYRGAPTAILHELVTQFVYKLVFRFIIIVRLHVSVYV